MICGGRSIVVQSLMFGLQRTLYTPGSVALLCWFCCRWQLLSVWLRCGSNWPVSWVRHQRSWQQCEPTTQGCWPQHHSHHKPNLVVAKDSNERKGIHLLLLSLCRVVAECSGLAWGTRLHGWSRIAQHSIDLKKHRPTHC